MTPLIQIQDLSRAFKSKTVLKKINLTADINEVIHIAGANGTGKSTLLRILGTLLRPSQGDIFINGQPLFRHQVKLRQEIIYIPSDEDIFFPRLTGLQNIISFCRFYSNDESDVKNKLYELSQIFSIAEALKTPYYQCSSGMKQKLKIALAFIRSGKVLLMDEPLQSLDRESRTQMTDVLRKMTKSRVCIYTEHLADSLQPLTTRALSLESGVLS